MTSPDRLANVDEGTDGAAAGGTPGAVTGPPVEKRRPGTATLTAGEVAGVLVVVAIAAVATVSLALAQVGHHDGVAAVAIGLAVTAVGAVAVRSVDGWPTVGFDAVEVGILAAVVLAGAFFFLPGFHYAFADKDPGIYVAHGFAIARGGDVYIDDPLVELRDSDRAFPGVWNDGDHPDQVTSQFYHLYSSLLATADDIGGPRAVFNATPLLAATACCLTVLATRRAAGSVVAVVAGGLLVTSMMQVWQAKYPSTEILAQLLLAGALLAAVLAVDRRWAGGAFVAGAVIGTGFLARPDGFLYVVLAAGVAGLVIAAGRADRRLAALLAGLAVTLPYAFVNAYIAREDYSKPNGVPGPTVLLGALVGLVAAGWVVRRVLLSLAGRFPGTGLDDPAALLARWRVPLGAVACVVYGVVLLGFYYRRDLFGEDYQYIHFAGGVDRTYYEMALRWLSFFFTPGGMVVMWLGLCVVLLQRWRAPLFVLVGTGALLLPLYLYNPRVSMRLMWSVRRFIPAVVPVIVILIAVAIGWALTRRRRVVQAAGAAVFVLLVVNSAGMSLPLRDHDEMGGSWDLTAAIAAHAGDDEGVFLFSPSYSGLYDVQRNAPAVLWFVYGHQAARLPEGYDIATVDQYQRAMPGEPVFLVVSGNELPEGLPADRFIASGTVVGRVTAWEEERGSRPDDSFSVDLGVTLWRLTGEPTPAGIA